MSFPGWRQWWRRMAETGPQGVGQLLLHALLLRPVAFLYALAGRLRLYAYRQGWCARYRAPVPVISVGNLAVGGTGKTPVVDYLLRYLGSRGERPAVVSRGYGGRIRAGTAVVGGGDGSAPLLPAAICGDEPYLLARRNPHAPVLVAPRRRDGVKRAVEEFAATIVILDDGFQHLAVARDLDLVLLDARRPFGNGFLLPAGLLREERGALQRGDLFLLTRSEEVDAAALVPQLPGPALRASHALAENFIALDGAILPLVRLRGARIVAFAGIADPAAFFRQLQGLGLELAATIPLDDHAHYDAALLADLDSYAAVADFFVTTEKDGVKLRPDSLSRPCCQAILRLGFEPQGRLEATIDSLFAKEIRG